MSKIKALFLIDWDPKKRFFLAENLRKNGIDCDVIGTDFFASNWTPIKKMTVHWRKCVGVSLRAFFIRKQYHYIISWQQLMGLSYGVIKRLLFSKLPRLIVMKTILSERKNPISTFFRKKTFKSLLMGADLIGCATLPFKEKIKRDFNIPEHKVIHMSWAYYNKFNPGYDTAKKTDGTIFSIGVSYRDYQTLINVAKKMDRQFVIVAPEFVVKGLDVPSNVTIRTGVFGKEAGELMKKASLVVIPLISSNFPAGDTVLFEAWTYAKPVIITRSIITEELVQNQKNGILIPPKDAPALEKAIRFMLEFPDKAKTMGIAGQMCTQNEYSMEAYAKRFANNIKKDYKIHFSHMGDNT